MRTLEKVWLNFLVTLSRQSNGPSRHQSEEGLAIACFNVACLTSAETVWNGPRGYLATRGFLLVGTTMSVVSVWESVRLCAGTLQRAGSTVSLSATRTWECCVSLAVGLFKLSDRSLKLDDWRNAGDGS